MRLTCPACGAQASAEAWANDAEARGAMQAVALLPRGVARLALPYIALFRPPNRRALGWARARKLMEQLKLLIEAPEISWGSGPHRPNPPEAWEQALEKLLGSPPAELPLRNHNYLRAIAYQLADQLDRLRERGQVAPARGASQGRGGLQGPALSPGEEVDYDKARQMVREIAQNLARKLGK